MEVLHLDEHLFVINKPPGRLSQPDHTGDPDVVQWGQEYLEGREDEEGFLGLVHRLDRPASGVMVLARTSDVARTLSVQFRERSAEKRYLVLVEGSLRGIGTWVNYIAKPGRQPKIVGPDHPDGRRAELQWQVLVRGEERTLLQVELHTGLPHQIRLQAAERGHPVVGDRRYGARTPLEIRAIALHHALLRIDHPERARRSTFVAPPPPFWQELLSPETQAAVRRLIERARPG